MSRNALVVVVGLGAYALINIALSLIVGSAWRAGFFNRRAVHPAVRARSLVLLRAVPATGGALLAALVVTPAFAIYEPVHAFERVGPVLLLLALIAVVQVIVSLMIAAVSMMRTRAVARTWLRSGTPLLVNPPAGVPFYAIDSVSPIVALVGVFSPTLVAARAVIDACTPDELSSIVAHERGHLRARDNLKRWMMACAPDALRWTSIHTAIETAWHDAAEDAADEVAAGADDRARANLAALIVKIARLAPGPIWPVATVSPFVHNDDVERRVRRLLAPGRATALTRRWLAVTAGALAVMAALAVGQPAYLRLIYDITESLIAFGR